MKNLKVFLIIKTRLNYLFLLPCLFFVVQASGQSLSVAKKQGVVFSAIKGTTSKPDTLTLATKNGVIKANGVKLDGAGKAHFKILSVSGGKNQKVVIAFSPSPDSVGIIRAALLIRGTGGKKIASIMLTGLSTKGLEGENEPPLSRVVDALGYSINVGWPGLANHTRPELLGDEINAGLFKKAGKGMIQILPVARYSPDFELPFGFYINTNEGPEKHQAGILAKRGEYPEHQTLFPAIASGSSWIDPGDNEFGFYATGPTHTAFSEDVWNMALYPTNAVRATRIYPVKSKDGTLLPNTYLVCYEEAKNGDYNDYVFLVKNIKPVTDDKFTTLFNGKDLIGWHTYLNKIGVNVDPDKNFRIEDGALHVIGKTLGYAMTDKSYKNFYVKVDFKWGVTKWPPREKNKRDGGLLYNSPSTERDTIWPQSVECQIQEGDVGDFWMIGNSTITVDGKINKPSNHTQIVKKKDNEKPYGEWNTVEVISYNGRCVQIVNGVVVNYGDNVSVTEGRLLLQSEYSEIYYKNVMLRQL